MKREEILEKINGIFRDVFEDEKISLTDTTTSADIDCWDSLIHITLIAEIEDCFDIKFPMRKVVSMKNVGEMINTIEEEMM